MMLVDTQIMEAIQDGDITITPYDEKCVDFSAYDFHLGQHLLLPKSGQTIRFDSGVNPEYEKIDIADTPYIIKPGEFLLAQTSEVLTIAKNIGMLVDGRTTLARLGLTIHQTAILISPGHTDSIITLELANVGNFNIELVAGMKIGKGIFFRTSKPSSRAYNETGKYPQQKEVMGAILTSRHAFVRN